MMILLDTDHVSILTELRHSKRSQLLGRLADAQQDLAIPIVSVEEQLRGWLAKIHSSRIPAGQIVPYIRLSKLIDFLANWRSRLGMKRRG